MGCDIHAFIEEKYLQKAAGYRCVAKLFLNRDYHLFALLAGVRNENSHIEPVYEPKGIPCDLSYQVNSEYEEWGEDAHSSSALSLDEVTIATSIFEDNLDCHTKHEIEILIGMMRDLNKPRLVFWFDN